MTREEERNKAAFEAYPANISYSTVIEQNVDYNRNSREIWLKGAEWADEHPKEGLVDINRACEFLEEHSEKYMKFHNEGDSTIFTYDYVELIQDIKQEMEEQTMAKSFCSGCKHWIYIPASEANGIGFHFCDIYDKYMN